MVCRECLAQVPGLVYCDQCGRPLDWQAGRGGSGEFAVDLHRIQVAFERLMATDVIRRIPPEWIHAAYAGTGKKDTLLPWPGKCDPAQVLGILKCFAAAGQMGEPIRFLTEEEPLRSLCAGPRGHEEVVRFAQSVGQLEVCLDGWMRLGSDFLLPMARALLDTGKPKPCLLLLARCEASAPGCRRLAFRAFVVDGRLDEATAAWDAIPAAECQVEDLLLVFKLFVGAGRMERAKALYGRIDDLRPVKTDPDLHYRFAAACEKAGDLATAESVYGKFAAAKVSYRDAGERLAALRAVSAPAPGSPSADAAPAPAPAPISLPPTIAKRYDLRGVIAEGSIGVVIDGFDRDANRKVAVKRLRREIRSEPRESDRFQSSARAIAQLEHPGIVRLCDVVEAGGDLFLVYEFFGGKPLAAVLAESWRLPLADCKRLLAPVCEALEFAHGGKVLHLGLNPSNVMVGADGVVKVTDFALARAAKDALVRLTGAGPSRAWAYMAPEQHHGEAVPASDVFSLGACLYEMLTGEMMFPGPDFVAQKEQRRRAASGRKLMGFPPAVDDMIATALEPNHKYRFRSPAEFLQRLGSL
ncbi:MAG: serine/threonine protein kinase [Elusimicrobia bacterium]|nr:serine/threonine protein kinase [Elusimicrobiota bacterium]